MDARSSATLFDTPGAHLVRIAQIEAGSIADELDLQIGTRIIRINGHPVKDGIDLTFLLADQDLVLETVAPSGEAYVYEIDRDPGIALGVIPEPDKIRECANECVFCFIDGNPKDVRQSLWLRDDDFRLSFTYGSYVTLTNLGPRGTQRLVDQRISPLYVSVHATEPDVRVRLLKNQRAGLIMDQLSFLLEHGIEVHTQVVLCPEWNDGAHLDRTISDLWGLGPGVRTLSVVPVGLTKYNVNRPVRPLTPDEASVAIGQVESMRDRARQTRESGWAYAADEPLPDCRSGGARRVLLRRLGAGRKRRRGRAALHGRLRRRTGVAPGSLGASDSPGDGPLDGAIPPVPEGRPGSGYRGRGRDRRGDERALRGRGHRGRPPGRP